MRKDEVCTVAVNDPLIMHFAHKLTLKHYADPDRQEHICCKIRECMHVFSANHLCRIVRLYY